MAEGAHVPLLRLKKVWRSYPSGDEPIHALKNVNLTIEAGEMVAIIGQSGSGKSTLMNILGCLDRPTKGSYRVAGRPTKKMTPNELASLRREHFGFIFQRYHLLPDLDARGNVEVPAVYAGKARGARRDRSVALLGRLGLADRLTHRPNQLSGGQQQRVSVARALMNGGEVILADEPTGALDSKSGVEMMKILKELNAEGHTIILVTHDPKVAAHARRIIEISDGEIIADYANPEAGPAPEASQLTIATAPESWTAFFDRVGEALRMALLAMNAHKLRTLLTMLGIIIGIAAVVTILALIGGAQKSVLAGVGALGSDAITIMPGQGVGDERAAMARGFNPSDIQALSRQTYVDSVTPLSSSGRTLRVGNITGRSQIQGVGEGFFRVQNVEIERGRPFTSGDIGLASQVVVIDQNTADKMFPDKNPLGQTLLLGSVPAKVIGVTKKQTGLQALAMGDSLTVYIPYTMLMTRMDRRADVQQISLKVKEGVPHAAAEKALVRLLIARRGQQDFFVITPEAFRQNLQQITLIFSVLFGVIGGISLLVGGIGVMNIMLVSVSERTREIGVRTAVGARQSDILSQFIIEAILVCLIGGVLGVALSMGAGAIFGMIVKDFQLVYSPMVMVAAFAVSSLIGIVFGWLPARNAAVLDPVDALARE
jgi:macrolide transport system ATP-binding/permease protein